MNILDSALSLIAPHHCLGCNLEGLICCQKCLEALIDKSSSKVCYRCSQKTNSQLGICSSCQGKQSLDGLVWFSDYKSDLAKSLIESLKFNNNYQASRAMADGLSLAYSGEIKRQLYKDGTMLCPIPTANKRVRQRGWDQTKLICKSFANQQRISYKSFLLRSSSFDQIGASKYERAKAAKQFFKPIRISILKGKRIILIDDVTTTGSTLDAAAKVLKKAGAKEVYGLVFARQGLAKIKHKA